MNTYKDVSIMSIFEKYIEKSNDLISEVLEAAIETKDLNEFYKRIVKIGAKYTNAASCVIFVKEGIRSYKGWRLSIPEKAAAGKLAKKLQSEKANYYVPSRPYFTEEGLGKKYTYNYLRKKIMDDPSISEEDKSDLKKQKDNKDLMDWVREKYQKCVMDYIKAEGDEKFFELVEKGELPMGITAFAVKTGNSVVRNGTRVREHPEWRGSYEGKHSFCATYIAMPLKKDIEDPNEDAIGVIKVENKKFYENITSYERLEEMTNAEGFDVIDVNLMRLLTNSVMIAIEGFLLKKTETFKKLIGIDLLKKVVQLVPIQIDLVENQRLFGAINEFYNYNFKLIIGDIVGLEEIFNSIKNHLINLASSVDLNIVLKILKSVGKEFEEILGTDIKYREHFVHQYQVFLLGYYIINQFDPFKEELIGYVKNLNNLYGFKEVLQIWFIVSLFHDLGYVVGKMDKWLLKFLNRLQITSMKDDSNNRDNEISKLKEKLRKKITLIDINWSDLHLSLEKEKIIILSKLTNIFKSKRPEELSEILDDVFFDKHDHGLISGLSLIKILLSKKEDFDKEIIEEAGAAITLHTLNIIEKIYENDSKKLLTEDSPFAFLLIFCDHAQDFGRFQINAFEQQERCKLKDIKINNSDNEFIIELDYPKLEPDKITEIDSSLNRASLYWTTDNKFKFKIVCYQGNDYLGNYKFE